MKQFLIICYLVILLFTLYFLIPLRFAISAYNEYLPELNEVIPENQPQVYIFGKITDRITRGPLQCILEVEVFSRSRYKINRVPLLSDYSGEFALPPLDTGRIYKISFHSPGYYSRFFYTDLRNIVFPYELGWELPMDMTMLPNLVGHEFNYIENIPTTMIRYFPDQPDDGFVPQRTPIDTTGNEDTEHTPVNLSYDIKVYEDFMNKFDTLLQLTDKIDIQTLRKHYWYHRKSPYPVRVSSVLLKSAIEVKYHLKLN